MFNQFFQFTKLLRSFSSHSITIIHEVVSLFGIGEFRHILLVRSLYKIAAKVFTRRQDKLISPNQPTFIRRRQCVNGIVAMNEIIDQAKKSKKSVSSLKLVLRSLMTRSIGVS